MNLDAPPCSLVATSRNANELATSDAPPGQAGAAMPPEGSGEGGGARLSRDARRGEHGSTIDGLQR